MARKITAADRSGLGKCPECGEHRVEVRLAGTWPQGRMGSQQKKTELICQECHCTEEGT